MAEKKPKPAYQTDLTWDSHSSRWKKKFRGTQFYPKTTGLQRNERDYRRALSEIREQIETAQTQTAAEKTHADDYARAIEIRGQVRDACRREIDLIGGFGEGDRLTSIFVADGLNQQFSNQLSDSCNHTDPLPETHFKPPAPDDRETKREFFSSLLNRMEREIQTLRRWFDVTKPRELNANSLPVVPLLADEKDPAAAQLANQLRNQLRHWLNWYQPTPQQMTVDSNLTAYLQHLRTRVSGISGRPLTGERFAVIANHLQHHFLPVFKHRNVKGISGRDLTAFSTSLSQKRTKDETRNLSPRTQNDVLTVVKSFFRWLYDEHIIDHEIRNLSSIRVSLPPPVPKPLNIEQTQAILKAATGRLKLWLCLFLNCGATVADLASIQTHEIDLNAGTITRKRSKTKNHPNVPLVKYKLWDETLSLLREFAVLNGPHVLTTETGQPLRNKELSHDRDTTANSDAVRARWRLFVKNHPEFTGITLRQFRSTSATVLASHPVHGRCTQFFLGHTPQTVADRHYIVPDQTIFDAAVKWLGEQFGF